MPEFQQKFDLKDVKLLKKDPTPFLSLKLLMNDPSDPMKPLLEFSHLKDGDEMKESSFLAQSELSGYPWNT